METKSTNEVKGDYDRVSASECLGSLIELHGIVMEDDLFVIPDVIEKIQAFFERYFGL